MARKVKEFLCYSGGKEDQMSNLGIFFLVFGIFGLVACCIVSGFNGAESWGKDGFSPAWITVGVASLIQGIALFIIISAGAEVIRLLKKHIGLNYSGQISEPYVEETQPKCSECGNQVHESATECFKCGKVFDIEDKKD